MLTVVMLIFLSIAGICFAEDPLETLNTVEDALSSMEESLNERAAELGSSKVARSMTGVDAVKEGISSEPEAYFISDELLGERGWVKVRPCTEESIISQGAPDTDSCAPPAAGPATPGGHLWKSRAAVASDLRAGVLVVARDKSRSGGWFLAKVTDVSELHNGRIAVSAPFKAELKNLRVVEE